jgi:hypothetical protein
MKPFAFRDFFVENCVEKLHDSVAADDKIVMLLTDPPGLRADFLPYMHKLDDKFDIVWIFADIYESLKDSMPTNANTHFIPNCVLMNYFRAFEQKLCKLNSGWNPDTGKFLFLTGKPNKPNRLGLLYEYYKHDLLDRCEYSFFPNTALNSLLDKLLPELTKAQATEFVNAVSRTVDIDLSADVNQSIHLGWPFDCALFSSTSFRVVSETWREDIPWITEKTYMTILNQQPFILAAPPGALSHLASLGFKTFNEYLPHANYDNIQDTNQRWQAVVENTKYWLDNIHKHKESIQKDVLFNFAHLVELAQQIKQNLSDILASCGDPTYNVYKFLSLSDTTDDWMTFYYNIKDPTWPDCYHHNQFNLLPMHIQKECVEVFNYQPRT